MTLVAGISVNNSETHSNTEPGSETNPDIYASTLAVCLKTGMTLARHTYGSRERNPQSALAMTDPSRADCLLLSQLVRLRNLKPRLSKGNLTECHSSDEERASASEEIMVGSRCVLDHGTTSGAFERLGSAGGCLLARNSEIFVGRLKAMFLEGDTRGLFYFGNIVTREFNKPQ